MVTSNADGLAENVADGVTGFVVPRRDPKALAEKLKILISSPKLRSKMSTAGRQRIIDNFQLDKQLDAFESFFQKLSS